MHSTAAKTVLKQSLCMWTNPPGHAPYCTRMLVGTCIALQQKQAGKGQRSWGRGHGVWAFGCRLECYHFECLGLYGGDCGTEVLAVFTIPDRGISLQGFHGRVCWGHLKWMGWCRSDNRNGGRMVNQKCKRNYNMPKGKSRAVLSGAPIQYGPRAGGKTTTLWTPEINIKGPRRGCHDKYGMQAEACERGRGAMPAAL